MHKTRCLRIFLIFDLTMQKVGGMMTDVKGLGLALSVNVVGYLHVDKILLLNKLSLNIIT